MTAAKDRTGEAVPMPTELDRRRSVTELQERISRGPQHSGNEAIAVLLDVLAASERVREPGTEHFERWLRAAGLTDDGPEVA